MPRNPTTLQRPESSPQTSAGPAPGPSIARAGANDLVTPDEIRLRAFQIYQRRGSQPGRAVEDWEQARRELTDERTARLRT